MKKLLVFFLFFIFYFFLAIPAQAQPQSCSADAPYEIIPSCVQCGNVLFCYGNKYRLCETDPKIPAPTGNLTQWLSPGDFSMGSVLYNSTSFPIPGGGVFVCDANVFGCVNELCDGSLGPGGPFPISDFECDNSAAARISRPDECELCSQTGRFCPACATDFQVLDGVPYQRKENTGNACLEKNWGGLITINPTEVTIPFVGHKGDENEQKYLADYLEGTNEYYENYNRYWLDWVNHAGVFRKLSPMTYQDQLKKQMVDRAAASKDNPGQESSIHNYQLEYAGRLCWDFPFTTDLFLAVLRRLDLERKVLEIFIPLLRVLDTEGLGAVDWLINRSHYCIFATNLLQKEVYEEFYKEIKKFNNLLPDFLKISISYRPPVGGIWLGKTYFLADMNMKDRQPPSLDRENYEEEWRKWKEKDKKKDEDEGKWFRLWQTVPMFSREDIPGQIFPVVGTKPEDTYTINPTNPIEKVPHVARLYEASREIQQMLTPFWPKTELAHQSNVIIAQPNPADEPSCYQESPLPIESCNSPSRTDDDENDSLCCDEITIDLTALERFENPYGGYPQCYYDGNCKKDRSRDPVCLILPESEIDCSTETPGECGGPLYPCCYWTHNCDAWETWDVNRRVGITLRHPYLTNIWNQTTNAQTQGLFNIFRPATIPPFIDLDAHSQKEITYQYSSTYDNRGYNERAEPSQGKFYFNHLAGIQIAKDWTVKALLPYGFEGELPPEAPTPTPTPEIGCENISYGTVPETVCAGEPFSINANRNSADAHGCLGDWREWRDVGWELDGGDCNVGTILGEINSEGNIYNEDRGYHWNFSGLNEGTHRFQMSVNTCGCFCNIYDFEVVNCSEN